MATVSLLQTGLLKMGMACAQLGKSYNRRQKTKSGVAHWMGTMGIVTVICPATGAEVPTGLVMDPAVFRRASFGPHAFVCDACGEAHLWEKPDGTVHVDGTPVPFLPGEK